MKKLISFFIIAIFSFTAINETSAKYVKSYIKKNWTFVSWHFKTSSNKVKFDNYSAKWNYNPYTWKKGYKKY